MNLNFFYFFFFFELFKHPKLKNKQTDLPNNMPKCQVFAASLNKAFGISQVYCFYTSQASAPLVIPQTHDYTAVLKGQ